MFNMIIDILFSATLLALLAVLLARFCESVYDGPTKQDETHYVTSRDGWRLAMHRYRPVGTPQGHPVILCHGLSANRYSFDLPGAPSLAEFLKCADRDVWVVELRGSGMSAKPGLIKSEVPCSWRLEDHLLSDLPALIAAVKSITASDQVHWVGHSMGGMLILAHLCSGAVGDIASAVVIGSPTDLSAIHSPRLRGLLKLRPILRLFPAYPLTILQRLLAPYSTYAGAIIRTGFWLPNTSASTASRVFALTNEFFTPTKMWRQFGDYLDTGVFGPGDGTSYVENLSDCTTPLLALAGSQDFMAPAEAVFAKMSQDPGSGERKRVVLGKEQGCVEDYGHIDLLVGDRAKEEVYPLVLSWLEEHESR